MKLFAIASILCILASPAAARREMRMMPPTDYLKAGPVIVVSSVAGVRDATFEVTSANSSSFHASWTPTAGGRTAGQDAASIDDRGTFRVTGLVPDTEYAFIIDSRSDLPGQNGLPSSKAAAFTFRTLRAPAPGPVEITGREIGQASATFELSSLGSTGILAWCYALGGGPGGVRCAVTPGATRETATLRVEGLVCGTTYECFFKNENDASNPLRNSVSFKPAPPTAPPPAPRLRSMKKTKTTATFATTTVPCAAGYGVSCRAKGSPGILQAKVSRTKTAVTVSLANLRPGAAYVCSVSAKNGAGKPGRALSVAFSTNK